MMSSSGAPTTMAANAAQAQDPLLKALLDRFMNKVLDREPSFTRAKALDLFKSALQETNGVEKVEKALVDDEGKLLMQFPEMIDVIQTDFLCSLSELDQRLLFNNYSSVAYEGRVDARQLIEDAGFPIKANPARSANESSTATVLANNSLNKSSSVYHSENIKDLNLRAPPDAHHTASADITSLLDSSRKTSSEMNQFHDFIQSEIASSSSAQYNINSTSFNSNAGSKNDGGIKEDNFSGSGDMFVVSPSSTSEPNLLLSAARVANNFNPNQHQTQSQGGRSQTIDDEYIAKLELENRKLKEALKPFNSEFFEEIEDMKYRYSNMQEIVSGANTRSPGSSSFDFDSSIHGVSGIHGSAIDKNRDVLIDKVSTFRSGSSSGNSEFFVNPARVGQFASISSSVPSQFSNLKNDTQGSSSGLSKSASLKKSVSFEDFNSTGKSEQIKFEKFATVCEDVVIESILHHPFGSDKIIQLLLSKLTEEAIKYSYKTGKASSMEHSFVHISQVASVFDYLQISLSPSDLLLFASGFASDGKGGMSLPELLDTLTTITTTKLILEKTTREAAMFEQKKKDKNDISLMKETQLYKDVMGEVVREILYNDKKSKYAQLKISLYDSFLEHFLDIDKYKIGILPFKLFYRAVVRLIGYSSNTTSNVNRGGSTARGIPIITRKKVMVTSTPFVVTNQHILVEANKVYGPKFTSAMRSKPADEISEQSAPDKSLLFNSILSGRFQSFGNNETIGKKFLEKSTGLHNAVQHFIGSQGQGGLHDHEGDDDGFDYNDFDNQYYEHHDGDEDGSERETDDFNGNFIDYKVYVQKLVEEFSSFIDNNGGFSSLMLFSKPFFLVEFEFVNVLLYQLELLSLADRRRRLLTLHYHVWNAKTSGNGKDSIIDGYQLLDAVLNSGFSISRVIRVQFLKSADLMNNRIDFVELIVILMSSVVNWSQEEKSVVLKVVTAMGITLNDRRVWLLSLKKLLTEARAKLYKSGSRGEVDAADSVAESIVNNSTLKSGRGYDKKDAAATSSSSASNRNNNRKVAITAPVGGVRKGSDSKKPAILEGDLVEGNQRDRGKWLPGKITRDYGNKTYDILYSDGQSETRVKEDMIRNPKLPHADSTDELLKRQNNSDADLMKSVLPSSTWAADEHDEDDSIDPCIPPMVFLRILSSMNVSLSVAEEAILLDCLDSERLFKNYYEQFWSSSTGRKNQPGPSSKGNFSDILLSSTSGLPLIYYSSFISFCGRYCGSWTDMLHTTSLASQVTIYLKQLDDPVQELSELSKMFHAADQAESVTTLAHDGGMPSVEATGFISKRSFLITCHRSRIFKDLTADLLKKLVESLCSESTGGRIPYFKLILFVRGLISSLEGLNGDSSGIGAVLDGSKSFNRNAIVGGIVDQLLCNGRDHLGCIFPIRNWLMSNTDYSNNIITLRELKILLKEFKVIYRSEDFDELVMELTVFSDDNQFLNTSGGKSGGVGSGRVIGLTSLVRLIQSRRNIWVKDQRKLCNKIKKLLTIQGSSNREQDNLRNSLSTSSSSGGGSGSMGPQSQFAQKLMVRLTSFATITTNLKNSIGGSASNSANAGSGNSAPSDSDKCHFIEADVFSLLVTSMGVSLTCNEVTILCDYCDNDVEASKLRCEVILDVLLPCTYVEDDIQNPTSDFYVDSADLKRGASATLASSRVGTVAKQEKASVDQFDLSILTVSQLKALNILRTLVLKNSALYKRKTEEWRLDLLTILDGFSCCNNGTSSPTGFVTTEDFESCLRLMNCIVSQDTLSDLPNYPGSKGTQSALVYYRPLVHFIFDPNSVKIKAANDDDDDNDDDFGIEVSNKKTGNRNTSSDSKQGLEKSLQGRASSGTSYGHSSSSSSINKGGLHTKDGSKHAVEAKAEVKKEEAPRIPIPTSATELYNVCRKAALSELVHTVMQDALNGSTSVNATIISDSVTEAKAMLMECFKQFDIISRGSINARDFCIAISTVVAATNTGNDADNDVIFSTKEWKEIISYLAAESELFREQQSKKRGGAANESSMSSSLSGGLASKAASGSLVIDYPMFIDLLFKDEEVKTLLHWAKKNPKKEPQQPLSHHIKSSSSSSSSGNTSGQRKFGGGNENNIDLNINVNFKDSNNNAGTSHGKSTSAAKRPTSASLHSSHISNDKIANGAEKGGLRANKTTEVEQSSRPSSRSNTGTKVRFARTAL